MKTITEFTPIEIDDADAFHVSEYGYYCDVMINNGEMPLSFTQWQIENFDPATTDIVYISEIGTAYTESDILSIAKGNAKLADIILGLCEWQHPETIFQELLEDGEIDENGNILTEPMNLTPYFKN